MLAQNFKSASELQITAQEHKALVTVLGMLERGEMTYVDPREAKNYNLDVDFNMSSCLICIGGHVKRIMGEDDFSSICSYVQFWRSQALHRLYYPMSSESGQITTDEAAQAIRRFMAGDQPWDYVAPSLVSIDTTSFTVTIVNTRIFNGEVELLVG